MRQVVEYEGDLVVLLLSWLLQSDGLLLRGDEERLDVGGGDAGLSARRGVERLRPSDRGAASRAADYSCTGMGLMRTANYSCTCVGLMRAADYSCTYIGLMGAAAVKRGLQAI